MVVDDRFRNSNKKIEESKDYIKQANTYIVEASEIAIDTLDEFARQEEVMKNSISRVSSSQIIAIHSETALVLVSACSLSCLGFFC